MQLELVGKHLDRLLPPVTLIAAVDNDKGGDQIAKQLAGVAATRPGVVFQRDSPDLALGKDWNDALQRVERDMVRLLTDTADRRGELARGR